MMRFHHALQGKGPRLPRAGRTAVIGCVLAIGVSYSQLLYGPDAHHSDFGRVEIPHIARPITDERVRVTATRGASGPVKVVLKPGLEEADSERTVRLLRRMREIGRRVLREERGQ